MFNWLRRNKSDKEWIRFRKQAQEHFQVWIQTHEEAKDFTSMKCHFCKTPASNGEANYCSHCGASLHTEPGYDVTDPGLYTTEPLQWAVAQERPFQAYRRQLQQTISEQETQQVAAPRPVGIRRTVRIQRLERLS